MRSKKYVVSIVNSLRATIQMSGKVHEQNLSEHNLLENIYQTCKIFKSIGLHLKKCAPT